jgi:CO/xanthine dehydrogenase FAD-binding subunit
MKPASFDYVRPANPDEACALLATTDEARVIAGGQSLVPLMAMRLARPKLLVDIARIAGLAYIRREDDALAIGACTRQCVIERDEMVRDHVPLLARVMPLVGHAATRARGTIGGSLAHGDPAAEIVLVAMTLDATLSYRVGPEIVDVPARQFFIGPMLTAVPLSGLLMSVRFPVWRELRVGIGFQEVSARRSDFAFVSAAAQIALDGDGVCRRVAVGVGAITDVALRLDGIASALTGRRVDATAARSAARAALADVTPFADLHATAEYRRRVAVALVTRAILDAQASAEARHAG